MFICWQKINFILHVLFEILLIASTCSYDFDVSLYAKKQISWFTSSLWHSIFKNPAIRWWNINNNISFHLRLFPGKTNDKIFQKNSKHLILGLGKKKIFLEKRVLSVFKYSNYVPSFKKSENANDPILRKIPNDWRNDRQTKRQTDRQGWFYRTIRNTGFQ